MTEPHRDDCKYYDNGICLKDFRRCNDCEKYLKHISYIKTESLEDHDIFNYFMANDSLFYYCNQNDDGYCKLTGCSCHECLADMKLYPLKEIIDADQLEEMMSNNEVVDVAPLQVVNGIHHLKRCATHSKGRGKNRMILQIHLSKKREERFASCLEAYRKHVDPNVSEEEFAYMVFNSALRARWNYYQEMSGKKEMKGVRA